MGIFRRILGGGAPSLERVGRASPAEGDRMVIEELRKAGSDLSHPSHLRHYLYFRTEESARAAGEELRAGEFEVGVDRAARGRTWLALAEHDLLLTEEAIAGVRSQLEDLAERLGGEYDGWEAAVNE